MPEFFCFEVSIVDIEPRIWRRFLLRKDGSTFADLHFAIQDSFGWEDVHVHCFEEPKRPGKRIAVGAPMGEVDDETPDSEDVLLTEHFSERTRKCVYVYDFGDNWRHEVELQGVQSLPDDVFRRLTAGERAGPPEDCGGVCGYEECEEDAKTVVANRTEEQHERLDWLGDWDPERFDLKSAAEEFEE